MNKALDNACMFVARIQGYSDQNFASRANSRIPSTYPLRINLTCFSSQDDINVTVSRITPLTSKDVSFIIDTAAIFNEEVTITTKGDASVDFRATA